MIIDFHVHYLDEPDYLEWDRKFLEALSLTAGEGAGYFADNAVSLLIRENAG